MAEIRFSNEAADIMDFLRKESARSKDERMILDALTKKMDIIKSNMFFGDRIKKNLIPSYYRKRYGATNLYRIELPQFWRMLYTIVGSDIEVLTIVLDICDHKLYDKRFGYKR
jgi:hypothetical protein